MQYPKATTCRGAELFFFWSFIGGHHLFAGKEASTEGVLLETAVRFASNQTSGISAVVLPAVAVVTSACLSINEVPGFY
ncbi:hypothetical protein [Pseudomonas taetrolens]|uniref:hypothetical protein n=1 Tax=Pseudomonas taetrolens TaxID=47884 RepID=UPI003F9D8036